MTSNWPLEEWGKLIGDVSAAMAILDRFLHHANLIKIKGKSYRMKEAAATTNDKMTLHLILDNYSMHKKQEIILKSAH